MDLIRRNTDYAIRAMAHLAASYGKGPVSAAVIAADQEVSCALVSKVLQRLQKAGLVKSSMGARGGFELAREPRRTTLLEVIEAVQGKVSLNRCLVHGQACTRRKVCSVRPRLVRIQESLVETLDQTTLGELIAGKGAVA
ncbi:MAG: Rrf2 family transcriptional regulator [Phycisphaerae bacterium]|nr:Rrf2 family transcriptional regulator [Phycisphaerae bacterium]